MIRKMLLWWMLALAVIAEPAMAQSAIARGAFLAAQKAQAAQVNETLGFGFNGLSPLALKRTRAMLGQSAQGSPIPAGSPVKPVGRVMCVGDSTTATAYTSV